MQPPIQSQSINEIQVRIIPQTQRNSRLIKMKTNDELFSSSNKCTPCSKLFFLTRISSHFFPTLKSLSFKSLHMHQKNYRGIIIYTSLHYLSISSTTNLTAHILSKLHPYPITHLKGCSTAKTPLFQWFSIPFY